MNKNNVDFLFALAGVCFLLGFTIGAWATFIVLNLKGDIRHWSVLLTALLALLAFALVPAPWHPIRVVANPASVIGDGRRIIDRLPLPIQVLLVVLPGFLAGVGGWIWGRYDCCRWGLLLSAGALAIWLLFGFLLLGGLQ